MTTTIRTIFRGSVVALIIISTPVYADAAGLNSMGTNGVSNGAILNGLAGNGASGNGVAETPVRVIGIQLPR